MRARRRFAVARCRSAPRASCRRLVALALAGFAAWPAPRPIAAGEGPPATEAASASVAGMASGDRASYATWNAHTGRTIHGVELRDADTGRLLTSASRKPPRVAGSSGWLGFGAAFLPDAGLKVPERLGIVWWFDEQAARRRDPALRQGPYIVALRSRLSERALRAAASGDRRFLLEIGVGGGVVPPVLRWQLHDRERAGGGRSGVVERGGDQAGERGADRSGERRAGAFPIPTPDRSR